MSVADEVAEQMNLWLEKKARMYSVQPGDRAWDLIKGTGVTIKEMEETTIGFIRTVYGEEPSMITIGFLKLQQDAPTEPIPSPIVTS